jgi:hypothetical protein
MGAYKGNKDKLLGYFCCGKEEVLVDTLYNVEFSSNSKLNLIVLDYAESLPSYFLTNIFKTAIKYR